LRGKHKLRALGDRVMRSIFGLERDEVTEEWRRLLYSSSSVIRVIKSRRMTWAGRVARIGERRGAYRILWKTKVDYCPSI
jgi:hypothetical protein